MKKKRMRFFMIFLLIILLELTAVTCHVDRVTRTDRPSLVNEFTDKNIYQDSLFHYEVNERIHAGTQLYQMFSIQTKGNVREYNRFLIFLFYIIVTISGLTVISKVFSNIDADNTYRNYLGVIRYIHNSDGEK